MVFNTYDKLLDYNPSHIGYFINKSIVILLNKSLH